MLDTFKILGTEMNDLDILRRIEEHNSNNTVVYYHRPCSISYESYVRSKQRIKGTDWHKRRNCHDNAFKKLCSFVQHNVIDFKKSFFLSSLKTTFVDFLKEEYKKQGDLVQDIFKLKIMEKKLLAQNVFKEKIKVVFRNNGKSIVAP